VFRLVSLLLAPILTLAVLELALRIIGLGHHTSFLIAKRIDGKDCVVQNDRFGWTFFGKGLARTPHPFILARNKPPGTVRIFVLGESAAYGDPQPAFGLPRMLEVLLAARRPQVRFEVVNAAMTAINSHVIVQIAKDCARTQADFWVIYMGNNEIIGPYGAGTIFGPRIPPLALIKLQLVLKTTRLGQAIAGLLDSIRAGRAGAQEWAGLAMFTANHIRHDDKRLQIVYSQFRRNLAEILSLGKNAGARLIVSTIGTNLKDCAPFGSMHRPDISQLELEQWQQLYQRAVKAQQATDLGQAIELLNSAARIDPTFADLQYRLGRCYLAIGQTNLAKECLVRARDYDSLRFRADSQLNAIIRGSVIGRQAEGIYLVDAQQCLAAASPAGIEGRELFYEHVHLRFEGNYMLAKAIASQIDQLLPADDTQVADWPTVQDCAKALAFTDWDKYQALTGMLARLVDRPFVDQSDHAEQYQFLQGQIQQIAGSVQASNLPVHDQIYRQAIQSRPDDWVLYANHAYLLQKLGRLDEAADAWQHVQQLLPHTGQGSCQIGIVRAAQGRYEQAIEAFKQALQKEPEMLAAIDGLASALASKGRYQEAIQLYKRALRIKPAFSQSRMGLALCLQATGKTNEAQEQLKLACEYPINTPSGLLAAGKACIEHGWLDQAIRHLDKAADIAPADAMIRFYLGLALSKSGQLDLAIQQYTAAVGLEPNLPEAHFQLGLALGRQGRHAEALVQFRQTLELRPELLEARLNLATALINTGHPDEALPHLKQVLQQDPTNPTALRQIKKIESAQAQ